VGPTRGAPSGFAVCVCRCGFPLPSHTFHGLTKIQPTKHGLKSVRRILFCFSFLFFFEIGPRPCLLCMQRVGCRSRTSLAGLALPSPPAPLLHDGSMYALILLPIKRLSCLATTIRHITCNLQDANADYTII
jgi:hypothetical protein